jgi:hypothetical protein
MTLPFSSHSKAFSVTGRFEKEIAQFCPKIAQFCPKIAQFCPKIAQNGALLCK